MKPGALSGTEGWSGGIGLAMPSFTLASQWHLDRICLPSKSVRASSQTVPPTPNYNHLEVQLNFYFTVSSHISVQWVFVEFDNNSCLLWARHSISIVNLHSPRFLYCIDIH